jgi:hypothetical protein
MGQRLVFITLGLCCNQVPLAFLCRASGHSSFFLTQLETPIHRKYCVFEPLHLQMASICLFNQVLAWRPSVGESHKLVSGNSTSTNPQGPAKATMHCSKACMAPWLSPALCDFLLALHLLRPRLWSRSTPFFLTPPLNSPSIFLGLWPVSFVNLPSQTMLKFYVVFFKSFLVPKLVIYI